jgi:hypothetical protein
MNIAMTPRMRKYPRTRHIEGSRLHEGDEDLAAISFNEVRELTLVVEEKIDGANSGLSFDEQGELLLQSRGHYLIGGAREKQFDLFKQWAATHRQAFYKALGCRYVVYGEWTYAKHTIFYDALPHYFLEFDVLDRETETFLDMPSRQRLLADLPIVSVPVLKTGEFKSLKELTSMIAPSLFIREGHIERLTQHCENEGLNVETAWRETDHSTTAEGLYIKHEQNGIVVDRFKFVRAEFLQTALSSGSHWLDRPMVPNQLARNVDELFLQELPPIRDTVQKSEEVSNG